MTDRINYLTVALDKDIREDEIHQIVSAIKQLRNVCAVEANVVKPSDYVALARARAELVSKIYDALLLDK